MLAVLITICSIVIIDQVLKYVSLINLMDKNPINWLCFEFSYYENHVNLFGRDINVLMVILSMVVLLAFVKFFFDYYTKNIKSKFNSIPFILVIGGGISNIIDRIARGFVVDYVTIPRIMKNTIFNFADACISVGIVLLIVYYLIKVTDAKVENIEVGNKENEVDSKEE